ncbi:MAG: ABC transporter ATP-binding protein [Oscillospiraceae bacterium]|nr:ABC transporter ATP-binding protein [Oscillospiraceae bacterium]
MKKILPFLKPYGKQLIVGPFFKLTEAILELLIPTFMGLLIDNGVKRGDFDYTVKTGLFMLALAAAGVFSAYICQYSASVASQGFGTDMRKAVFRHIGTFSRSQTDLFGTSSLINRMTSDINQLQSAVAMLIRLVIRAPFLCIGGLVMAMLIDIKLSIVFMMVIPLFIFVLTAVMKKTVPLYSLVQGKLDRLSLLLRENFSGIRVIRAFSAGEREKERFNAANREYASTAVYVGKIAAATNPVTTLIMNFAVAAVILAGGIRVNSGSMTQGRIIAFINYLTLILNAMIVVADLVVLYTKAYASSKRVEEILNTEPDMKYGDRTEGADGETIVEFKNVSLKYPNAAMLSLEGISFKVRRGETIGIIGATGSGKSSLVNMIPRFYDAEDGEVMLFGRNIKEYTREFVENAVSPVMQKAVLFGGTVAENLRMGNKNASDGELEDALRAAQAYDFIDKLDDKLNSRVERGGMNFSGGQRQRLTIARALVKKSDILILDDSASALDSLTESNLRKALANYDKTMFVVSQRVISVMSADKIIVLDDGKIAGIGTHERLFEDCEIYKEICISQEAGGAA